MNEKQLAYEGYSMEYFFSIIFVGLSIGLSYAQYKIIKNHMHAKKYIWFVTSLEYRWYFFKLISICITYAS